MLTDPSATVDGGGRPHGSPGRQHLLAALVIAVLVAAFFKPIVLDGATFSTVEVNQRNTYPWADRGERPTLPAQADQAQYSHPRQVFLDDSLKRDGVIPLWDPNTLGGHPSFASGPGLAYPPRLILTLLFDPSWTHDLYLIVHIFAAGMAMFALMKHLGIGFLGAMLASVAWAFSSYSLGWITLEPFAAVAALLPLALLFVRRWYDQRSWPQLLIAAWLLGLLYLGSSIELALISFIAVAGYAACLALQQVSIDWRRCSRIGLVSAVAAPLVLVVVALSVAAVGVLPFVDLMGSANRVTLRYSEYVRSTYPGLRRTSLTDFLHTFVPAPTPLVPATLISQSAFVGTATGLLALPALFLRRPGTGFGRGALAITLLFIIGTPVTWISYHLVPGLSSLNGLGRSSFVWNLGIALLGGIGLDSALGWLGRRTGSRNLPIDRWTRAPTVIRALGLLCVAATAAQLLVYGRYANVAFQSRDPSSLFPTTPAVAALREAQGPTPGEGRGLPFARVPDGRPPPDGSPFITLTGNAGQTLGLRLVTGYENVVPARTLQLWRYLRGEEPSAVLSDPPTTTLNLVFPTDRTRRELLGRLGVAALLAPPGVLGDPGWSETELDRLGLRRTYLGEDGLVLRVADPTPRAVVVSNWTLARGTESALTALIDPAFDPRRSVILEATPRPDGGGSAPAVQAGPQVVWLDQGPNGARLSVTTAEPGWLVILESWDPGWRATVGGRPTEVERADFAFQAIRVPAGNSAVTLTYRPPEVLEGAAVSAATTAALLVVVSVDGRRRRRARRLRGRTERG